MSGPRLVDPLALPEAERRRLDEAIRRARLADLRPRAVVEPLVLAAGSAAFLAVLVVRNLGVLPWKVSQHGVGVVLLWALGLFSLGFASLAAWRAHRLRSLPQGRALTTGELLDLRGTLVVVHGLEHLEEIREAEPLPGDALATVKLCFDDGSFAVFHLDPRERRAILRDLEETAARLREAHARVDRPTLQALQLFVDLPPVPVGEGPFRAASNDARFEPPAPSRRHALLAAGLACLAPFAWWGRNAISDELAYQRALREDDVAAWLAYVDGAPRREAEAREEHLPRARLRQARRHGIDGLRSFLRLYGETAVAEEAAEELQRLLATEGPM